LAFLLALLALRHVAEREAVELPTAKGVAAIERQEVPVPMMQNGARRRETTR
jgi:hypothetical protein